MKLKLLLCLALVTGCATNKPVYPLPLSAFPEPGVYLAQTGDNATRIATNLCLSKDQLLAYNPGVDFLHLKTGQRVYYAPPPNWQKIVSPQSSVDLPELGQAIFREQSSNLSLQVPINSRKLGEKLSTTKQTPLDLQVWLLKTDGTAIRQSNKPSVVTLSSIGDYATDYMFYLFPKVPANELSGVVINLNGKLYCHEIEKYCRKP